MLKSVQLTLMMGPILPVTVPRVVIDSLLEVEVKIDDVGQSGFQLAFSIDKQSPLQILFLLTGGMPLLFMRVILVATVNGSGQCADRWSDHQQSDFPRRQGIELHTHDHRQRPDRADGPIRTGAAFPFRPARARRASRSSWPSTRCSA